MSKKIMIVISIFSLFICGCDSDKKEVKTYDTEVVENKSEVSELDKILSKNNYIIVDVRTKEEYETGHVKGAINIPYDTIDDKTNLDINKTILVYCKSGARSAKAYQTLKDLKYDVYDLGAYSKIQLDKE